MGPHRNSQAKPCDSLPFLRGCFWLQELLEERLERVAQGDALQSKMEDIAASYQEQVDMMGREIEEVRESLSDESAVARAVSATQAAAAALESWISF